MIMAAQVAEFATRCSPSSNRGRGSIYSDGESRLLNVLNLGDCMAAGLIHAAGSIYACGH
jgi:hypothetical protein